MWIYQILPCHSSNNNSDVDCIINFGISIISEFGKENVGEYTIATLVMEFGWVKIMLVNDIHSPNLPKFSLPKFCTIR